MITEWNVPFTLLSPVGSLAINDQAGADGWFQIIKERSSIRVGVRAQRDNIPQADGAIMHRRWTPGVEATLAIQFLSGLDTHACDAELSTMADILRMHCRALLRAGDNQGRLIWTPDGADTRMLDDIRLLSYPEPSFQDDKLEIQFTVDTGYPYAIDSLQTIETVSGSGTITMTGTADFWPVLKVTGSDAWTVTNNGALDEDGNPLSVVYDSSRPGAVGLGGGFAEIDFFRGTAYLNGTGANLSPGIDHELSDGFPLVVGANDISITGGASVDFLTNQAWG